MEMEEEEEEDLLSMRLRFSIVAAATSERRRPPVAQANSSRARSRCPRRVSSQVANKACSGSLVRARCFRGRAPRCA
jgi:hypothetical protein